MNTTSKASPGKAATSKQASSPRPSHGRQSPHPHSGILNLQRSVGNRATVAAIQASKLLPPSELNSLPSVVQDVVNSGTGRSLDSVTRSSMEDGFAHNFGQVRIHTGPAAAASARAVKANAYTVGNHIVFDTGQYAPMTQRGKKLLAHELAHTLQQGNGAFSPHYDSPDGDAFESHARRVADCLIGAMDFPGSAQPKLDQALLHPPSGRAPLLQREPREPEGRVSTQRSFVAANLEEQPETLAERMADDIGGGSEVRAGIERLKRTTPRKLLLSLSAAETKRRQQKVNFADVLRPSTSLYEVTSRIWYVASRLYVLDRHGHIEGENPHFDLNGTTLPPGTYFMGQFLSQTGRTAQGSVQLIRLGDDGSVQFVPKREAVIRMRSLTQDTLPLQKEAKEILKSTRDVENTRAEGNAGIAIIVSSNYRHPQQKHSPLDYDPQKVLRALNRAKHHVGWMAATELLRHKEGLGIKALQEVEKTVLDQLTDAVPIAKLALGLMELLQKVGSVAETLSIAAHAKQEGEIDIAAQIIARALVQLAIGKLEGYAKRGIISGVKSGVGNVRSKLPLRPNPPNQIPRDSEERSESGQAPPSKEPLQKVSQERPASRPPRGNTVPSDDHPEHLQDPRASSRRRPILQTESAKRSGKVKRDVVEEGADDAWMQDILNTLKKERSQTDKPVDVVLSQPLRPRPGKAGSSSKPSRYSRGEPATYTSTEHTTKRQKVSHPEVIQGRAGTFGEDIAPSKEDASSMNKASLARERALERHSQLPTSQQSKTVAAGSSGAESISGKSSSTGGKSVDDVIRRAKEMGLDLPSHGRDPADKPGGYYAGHAEPKIAEPETGVSRSMCEVCIRTFREEARTQQRNFVVADPQCIRIFEPNGTYTEYWDNGIVLRFDLDGSVTAQPARRIGSP